jgi:hypothetical protein
MRRGYNEASPISWFSLYAGAHATLRCGVSDRTRACLRRWRISGR